MIEYIAQAETASVGNALDKLIEQGVIGAIAALAIIGLVVAVRLLLKEKDKRVDDASKTLDNIAVPIKSIQESITRMEGKIVISKEANGSANE